MPGLKRLIVLVTMLLSLSACQTLSAIPIIAGGLSITKDALELYHGRNPLEPDGELDRRRIACKAFETGQFSYKQGDPEGSDTLPTIAWIKGHNAAYRSLKCEELE